MPDLAASRLLRRNVLVPAAYVLATIALVLVVGVPYERDLLALWLVLGMLCFSLSDLRGYWRAVALEWLPFIGLLIAYDSLRGGAGDPFAVHYLPPPQNDPGPFCGAGPARTPQHRAWDRPV